MMIIINVRFFFFFYGVGGEVLGVMRCSCRLLHSLASVRGSSGRKILLGVR
jgi:hypothetical protein